MTLRTSGAPDESAWREFCRLLHRSHKNKGKDPVPHEMPMMEVPASNCIPLEQGSSSHVDHSKWLSFSGNSEDFRMVPLPDLINQDLLNLETGLHILDIPPIQTIPSIKPSANYPIILQPDLPTLPECQDLAPEPVDISFMHVFNHHKSFESESKPKSLTGLPSIGIKGNAQMGKNDDAATLDSFFDELPTDMFDCLDPLPNSSEW